MNGMLEAAAPRVQSESVPLEVDDRPLTVVEPRKGFSLADLQELWRYRELFYHLTLRELKLRGKQTSLGVGW